MNYRHHFHAGNFADVLKHALLVELVRALQRKEKGLLFLDTHAGRGRYDLDTAAAGASLVRKPEWPDGIGRLGSPRDAPPALGGYLDLVRACDREAGNLGAGPRFYPGSPWLLGRLLRPVDRVVLCERHPAECDALRAELGGRARTEVRATDGYAAMRALLPPRERRALVLLDPPYEAADEFSQLAAALREAVERFRTGVYAVWYPLTTRARADEFLAVVGAGSPPALVVELTVAGEASALKMRGCGLLMLNPPWRFELTAGAIVEYLARVLAQAPGGGGRVEWLVASA